MTLARDLETGRVVGEQRLVALVSGCELDVEIKPVSTLMVSG
jgi:hypothetical protein